MKKTIFAMLLLVIFASCSENKKSGTKAPTRVKTEVLSPALENGSQNYVGIVEEREATAVSFTGMGVVRRVLVSEGQAVGRGQLIAEMDNTQARNMLSGAEAQMAQANDALARYKMLHDAGSLPEVKPVTTAEEILRARRIVGEVYIDEKIEQYIADIVFATRYPERYGLPEVKDMITFGGSPRASINLAKAARAYAFIKRRGYVVPEDVRAVAHDVLRHRIGLSYEAEAANITSEEIVSKVINKVEVP